MKYVTVHQYAIAAAAAILLSACSMSPKQLRDQSQINMRNGDYASAITNLKAALKDDEKNFGLDSLPVSDDLLALGEAYRKQGKLMDAEDALRRSVEILRRQGGLLPLARGLNAYGLVLIEQENFKEAENILQDALNDRQQGGASPAEIADSQNSLGQLYYEGGVWTESKQLFEQSYATAKETPGPDSAQFADVENNLAGIYLAEGKFAQAEQMLLSSLSTSQRILGRDQPEVASCLNNLGEVYRVQGKYSEAEPRFRAAIAIYQKIGGPTNPNLAACFNNLALLYQAQKMYEQAEPLYKQAIAIQEKHYGQNRPDLGATLRNYAQLLQAANRPDEAKQMMARANNILAANMK